MKATFYSLHFFLTLRQFLLIAPITSETVSKSLRKRKNEKPRKDLTLEQFSIPMNSNQDSSISSQTQIEKYRRHLEHVFLEPHDYENETLNHFARKWEASALHEVENHDRFGISREVDYGGSHPFEFLERHRQLGNKNGVQVNEENYRSLQMMPWKQDKIYKPIRISLDTQHLDLVPNEYSKKSAFLQTAILPQVVEFWTSALRVFPIASSLKIDGDFCPYSDISQIRNGVPGTDLLIFVAANVKSVCDNGALSAARSCQADQFDRPSAGSLVVCLDKLDLVDENIADTYITMLIHEFAHILGMRAIDFAYYHDANTGLPRTSRPFKSQRTICVDGAVSDVVVPSANTIQQGKTAKGSIYYEIVTPAVRTVTRNQFNCQSMVGARLENQPTNDGNCFGSHWEARLFASEILSAITTQTKQVLSPLSLALFEDSGWYKPDYSVAEISPFGHGRGCNFVYDDCIDENGDVPEWGEGFFCNEKLGQDSKLQCDGSRENIARCDLIDFSDFPHSVPPDDNYQYFKNNPTWGGLLHTAAYCPMPSVVVTGTNTNGLFEYSCSNMDLKSDEKYEYFGEDSKCYETNLSRPICMKTFCNTVTKKLNIVIDDRQVVVCEKDGDWMKFPGSSGNSFFQCPPIATVCPDLICPQNCAGRGVCDFTKPDPICVCCNQADTSQTCQNSPIGCEYNFDAEKTSFPFFLQENNSNPTKQPTINNKVNYIEEEAHVQSPSFSKTVPPVSFPSSFSDSYSNQQLISLSSIDEFGIFQDSIPTKNPSLRPQLSDPIMQIPMETPFAQYPSPSPFMYDDGFPVLSRPTNSRQPLVSKSPTHHYDSSLNSEMPTIKQTETVSLSKSTADISNLSEGYILNPHTPKMPSARPSILSRDTIDVIYTFCIEHGTLVPISEVLSDSEKSINSILNDLFQDDIQVMGNKWSIDEKHLHIQDIKSVWLEVPPPEFECTCVTGNNISSCSSVRSTVRVSYWDQLDRDEVRYLLIYFAPYLSGGMGFKAKYWGFQVMTTRSNFIMEDLPSSEMTDESKRVFEETIKSILNEKVGILNVEGLHILNVGVEKIVPFLSNRLLREELNQLGATTSYKVSLVTTGEYIPPPFVDFREIIFELIESNNLEMVAKLKESGDPLFKDLKGIKRNVLLVPTALPTATIILDKAVPEEKATGGSQHSGIPLWIIIITILAGVIITVTGFIYLNRHSVITRVNEKMFRPQKSLYTADTLDCGETVSISNCRSSGRFTKYDQFSDSSMHCISDNSSTKLSKHSHECSISRSESFSEITDRNSFHGRDSISTHSTGEYSYDSWESQNNSYNPYSGRNSYSNDTIDYVAAPRINSFSSTRHHGYHQPSSQEEINFESKNSYHPSFQNRMVKTYLIDPPEEMNDNNNDNDTIDGFSTRATHSNFPSNDTPLWSSTQGIIESVSESKMESKPNDMTNLTVNTKIVALGLNCEIPFHSTTNVEIFDNEVNTSSHSSINISDCESEGTENSTIDIARGIASEASTSNTQNNQMVLFEEFIGPVSNTSVYPLETVLESETEHDTSSDATHYSCNATSMNETLRSVISIDSRDELSR